MIRHIQRREFLQTSCTLGAVGLLLPGLAWSENRAMGPLHAGPMAGYPAERSARIWLQSRGPARVQLLFRDRQGSARRSEAMDTRASTWYTAQITLDDLTPGQEYQVTPIIDGRELPQATIRVKTPVLWRWRSPPPDFSVLTGSCAYINDPLYDRPGKPYGGGYEIYQPMTAEQADLMVWLGDNLYFREGDLSSPEGMALRYWSDRSFAPLQQFLRSTAQVAIWDDHDYGPNDSDSSFVFKGQALSLFQHYWNNPTYGLPGIPGIFTQFSLYDADFFLLDDRWYRDADAALLSTHKVQFGKAQLDWLKNALLDSHARFKIIAAGGQMLNDDDAYEGWNQYPEERQEFLGWLQDNHIPGVIFLSGDRHISELMRRPRPRYSGKQDYPLWEITSSPLNSSPARGDKNPYRVPQTLVEERNYVRLDFRGQGKDRQLLVSCKGAQGQLYWQHAITGKDLGYESA